VALGHPEDAVRRGQVPARSPLGHHIGVDSRVQAASEVVRLVVEGDASAHRREPMTGLSRPDTVENWTGWLSTFNLIRRKECE
jgi:hypothetical protein